MSAKKIAAVRGMKDCLPTQTGAWQDFEGCLRALSASAGFREIRFPLVESTDLFCRSIGEGTDIVEKEMYTFNDLNGESLTLRPEGTASCVRACIEHGLLFNQVQKLWYMGPVFRHERPQKARYRQFHQFGMEVFGIAGCHAEFELLQLTHRLWQKLGVSEHVELQLNTLGSAASRQAYRAVLVDYFTAHSDVLDADSLRRLDKNPLRILDSKNPALQSLIEQAPKLTEHLDDHSRQQFETLCCLLDAAGIAYTHNPRLVRGLDYYNGSVFEWVTNKLGAQGTICAGGRYDGLVEKIGGKKATPAVGFGLGIERVLELKEALQPTADASAYCQLYLISQNERALTELMLFSERARAACPGWRIYVDVSQASLKGQFKRADASGARYALIVGEDELTQQTFTLKDLRHPDKHAPVVVHSEGSLIDFLKGEMQ